jgi:Pentapeptide repeats (8 copies)
MTTSKEVREKFVGQLIHAAEAVPLNQASLHGNSAQTIAPQKQDDGRERDTRLPELDKLDKALSLWKLAAEAEKCEAEAEKARREAQNIRPRTAKSEKLRFWIPAIAPFVGFIALAGTVWVQFQQYNASVAEQIRAEKQKEDERETSEFQAAIQAAKLPESISALASMPLLQSSLEAKSASRRKTARQVSILLLGASAGPQSYEILFPALFPKLELEYLPDLARLSRMLKRTYDLSKSHESLLLKRKAALRQFGFPPQLVFPPGAAPVGQRQAVPQMPGQPSAPIGPSAAQSVDDEIDQVRNDLDRLPERPTFVAEYIGRVLRQRRHDPTDIDLTETWFWNSDLSGVDFGNAVLTGAYMESMNVKGARLTKVSQFRDSRWDYTAWWRTSAIGPDLLKFAITGSPQTREKVLRLNRLYAQTISGDFYENNRFPAYCYDKLVCGLIDSHQFAGDPDAFAILDHTTDTAMAHLPGKAVEHGRKWRKPGR